MYGICGAYCVGGAFGGGAIVGILGMYSGWGAGGRGNSVTVGGMFSFNEFLNISANLVSAALCLSPIVINGAAGVFSLMASMRSRAACVAASFDELFGI
eukprot:3780561-Ditylum_brightwellii.AAC.1